MSLYVFAPAAAGAPPDCAGAWPPQPASMASARNATITVGEILEALITHSFLVVIVHSDRGLSFDRSQTSHSVMYTSSQIGLTSPLQRGILHSEGQRFSCCNAKPYIMVILC